MATKKQRRRREKLMRHEYEYVVETEEGTEVVEAPRPKKPAAPQTAGGRPVPKGALVDARGRVIQPPSWRRVAKRTAIFGPIMVLVVLLLGGNSISTTAKIINAVFLVAIFLPFSYFTDWLIFRQVQKRQQRQGSSR